MNPVLEFSNFLAFGITCSFIILNLLQTPVKKFDIYLIIISSIYLISLIIINGALNRVSNGLITFIAYVLLGSMCSCNPKKDNFILRASLISFCFYQIYCIHAFHNVFPKNTLLLNSVFVILVGIYLIYSSRKLRFVSHFLKFLSYGITLVSFSRQFVLVNSLLLFSRGNKVGINLKYILFFVLAISLLILSIELGYLWRFTKLTSFDAISSTSRYEAFFSAFKNEYIAVFGNKLSGEVPNQLSNSKNVYFDSTIPLVIFSGGIIGMIWFFALNIYLYKNLTPIMFLSAFLMLLFNEFYEFEQLLPMFALVGSFLKKNSV